MDYSNSYQYYKEHVTIIEVAESLGYEHNRKKGSGRRVEYCHPTEENIIITRANAKSNELYFTRFNDLDRGSVIDFVKNRLHLFKLGECSVSKGINSVLSGYVGPSFQPLRSTSFSPFVSKRYRFSIDDYELSKPSIKDLSYLKYGRKLDSATLSRFMPFLYMARRLNPTENSFRNIGFPYSNPTDPKEQILGLELVNYNWRLHAEGSDKSNTMWLADLSMGGIVDKVVLGESGINLMSFYELYSHRTNLDNVVLAATGGAFADNQIMNLFRAYPYSKIVTAFDNDLAGCLYDIKLASLQLNKKLQVLKNGDLVTFRTSTEKFSLPQGRVNLTNFRKMSKWRPSIQVFKSTIGTDFNDMLKYHKEKGGYDAWKTNNRTY